MQDVTPGGSTADYSLTSSDTSKTLPASPGKVYDIRLISPSPECVEEDMVIVTAQGTGTINPPPSTYSNIQKVQYYLDKMGFDIGKNTDGTPKIDGDFGTRTDSALILVQYYLGSDKVNGIADTDATVQQVASAANNGTTYAKVMGKMATWTPGASSSTSTADNGFVSTTNLVRIPTEDYGYDVIQKETAIGWAMMIQGVVDYNGTVLDTDKLLFNSFSCSDGYRPYADQVRLYAGDYLGISGYNYAVPPIFDNSTANSFISSHKDDFIANPHYFDSYCDATGTGKELSGYGSSPHGRAVAIDLNPHDAGSWGDYTTANNDPLCPKGESYVVNGKTYTDNDFRGTYGTGEALTKEVPWIHSNGSRYGFISYYYTAKQTSIKYDGSDSSKNNGIPLYRETWHKNYTH